MRINDGKEIKKHTQGLCYLIMGIGLQVRET